MTLLSDAVVDASRRSVLCWLATVGPDGMPNVSPKEIWTIHDETRVLVANVASPRTVRNLAHCDKVCLSFVDVFVQKGFKLTGLAQHVNAAHASYRRWAEPLLTIAGPRFPIHGVIVIEVSQVEPIVAPSYRLFPTETTKQGQVAAAMRTYGVSPAPGVASLPAADRGTIRSDAHARTTPSTREGPP
ncbi:MAG: pyridoxamine 5'-phosphate oxidase family protein [Lautropia sp.]